MAQSVELTFDPAADAVFTAEWRRLGEAGLPSAERPQPNQHHRPHLTLFAGQAIPPESEAQLAGLVEGLELTVRVGAVLLFGPRRGAYVLVRQVVPSAELIELQRRVAEVSGANRLGQFGPGRWSPHVTLARRIRGEQLPAALTVLDRDDEVEARITQCRRWDGDAKTAWWLTVLGERHDVHRM